MKEKIGNDWIIQALNAVIKAGAAILEVYDMSDQEISLKEDLSPITLADRRADNIIKDMLRLTGIPVFTEESSNVPYATRKTWDRYWLVDPLDGTKEFIHHNDEFTVNIALIEDRVPVFGVIYVPVYRQLYFAMKKRGAYRIENVTDPFSPGTDISEISGYSVRLPDRTHHGIRIAVSRSHMSPGTEAYLREKLGDEPFEMVYAGSSLKFCRVAEGEADLYPRLGPTMEWDIAAGTIIMTEAGGIIRQYDGKPLIFNRENLLNPWFVAASGKMTKALN